MTRKDYVVLATALAKTRPLNIQTAPLDSPAIKQWGEDVRFIAAALAQDNPRFDRQRFIDACHAPVPEYSASPERIER